MATTTIPAVPDNNVEKLKEGTKLWGPRILRSVQALLVLFAATALGLYLGEKYARPLVPLAAHSEAFRYVFGIAAVLSTLNELLKLLPKVWEYVKTGKGSDLYDVSSFVFLTSLTVAVAFLLGMSGDKTVVTDPNASINPIIFLQPSGRNAKFLVPFSESAEGCDANADKFKLGLNWLPGTEKFIDQLALGISHCSVPGKPVKIEVRGFASSADFQASGGQKCTNSNDLNVQIANLRADKVSREVTTALGTSVGAVSITPRHWNSSEFDAMRREATFNDRDADNKPVKERGDLTRRADIVVTDASDCEPR